VRAARRVLEAGIKVIPMMVRIVPMTTGGKHFTNFPKKGAKRNVAIPAVITAP
jgi:hypothetical protein